MTERTYVFTDAPGEDRRLRDQATVLDPLTRRLFADAGLAPGMRVLDLGSGAGNVAVLAAEAVGPDGCVVGIDRDPDAVERARQLAAGTPNVEFREGDLHSLDGVDGEFDAVVGRLVLTHLPDPVAALRRAAGHVRPGGLVCMHEADLTSDWTSHQTPLWDQVRGWLLDTCTRTGVDTRMGPSLFATFRSAGLPDPELVLEAPVGGGASSPAFGWANVVGALVPVMEGLGITTGAAVGVETLTERLDAEISAHHGTVVGPLMYGAWSRVPNG